MLIDQRKVGNNLMHNIHSSTASSSVLVFLYIYIWALENFYYTHHLFFFSIFNIQVIFKFLQVILPRTKQIKTNWNILSLIIDLVWVNLSHPKLAHILANIFF